MKAMELFWERGYEGATLADLQRIMGGITAPSFYAAFGSKEKLFREAVALYNQTEGAPMVKALLEGSTARNSIENWLHAVAKSFCRSDKPRGCFVVLGAINCMPDNKTIEHFMGDQRSIRDKFVRQRLQRGISDGDISPSVDIAALSSFLNSVVDGMAIRARDGASCKTLKAIADHAIAAWEPVTTKAVGTIPARRSKRTF
jgi:AcrR family transcriptional regulator